MSYNDHRIILLRECTNSGRSGNALIFHHLRTSVDSDSKYLKSVVGVKNMSMIMTSSSLERHFIVSICN